MVNNADIVLQWYDVSRYNDLFIPANVCCPPPPTSSGPKMFWFLKFLFLKIRTRKLEGNQQMTFNMHEQLQEVALMIRIFNGAFNPCKSCVRFTSSRTLDGIYNF